MNLIAGILKFVVPFFKEYLVSSVKRADDISRLLMQTVSFLGFIWIFLLVFHMTEQAKLNLEAAKPLIDENKTLVAQNEKLKNYIKELKKENDRCYVQFKKAEQTCELKK